MRAIVVVTCPVCTFELVPVTAVLWKCDMDYFGLLQLAGTEYYYYCGVEERYVFSLVVVATGHKIISSVQVHLHSFLLHRRTALNSRKAHNSHTDMTLAGQW